jgi:four helix bundle protein
VLEKPHKKLDIWQKSIVLVQKIYELTKSFPKIEDYGLTNQMRRTAILIPANISEGAARQTKKEFIQFLHMAQGLLSELDTHLDIVRFDEGKLEIGHCYYASSLLCPLMPL